jgi:hypothetical protein
MDSTAFISGYIAAQIGRLQLAAAAKLMRMSEDGVMVDTASVAKLVDAAGANVQQFANAAGLGTHLDITV